MRKQTQRERTHHGLSLDGGRAEMRALTPSFHESPNVPLGEAPGQARRFRDDLEAFWCQKIVLGFEGQRKLTGPRVLLSRVIPASSPFTSFPAEML